MSQFKEEIMTFRGYVNRKNFGQNNAEILNKFHWDFIVTKKPNVVYWPPDQILKTRLLNITGLPSDMAAAPLETEELCGGFKVIQPGEITHDPVTITFNFQDFEDSSIGYLVHDWYRKTQDPEVKVSNTKADLVCDMEVYQLNTRLLPVKKWRLYNGLYEGGNTNDGDFGNKKELSGKVDLMIKFEWWDVDYLNAV
jgi:hypothetical protein